MIYFLVAIIMVILATIGRIIYVKWTQSKNRVYWYILEDSKLVFEGYEYYIPEIGTIIEYTTIDEKESKIYLWSGVVVDVIIRNLITDDLPTILIEVAGTINTCTLLI